MPLSRVSNQQDKHPITVFAETTFRNQRLCSGIKRADRLAHTYLIAKTGTGKSTLIANLARHDALNGEGFARLTPTAISWNKYCVSCLRSGNPT